MFSLIRWTLEPEGGFPHGQVECLRSQVAPLRREIPHPAYASRQGDGLWLTVLASDAECRQLETSIVFHDCGAK